MLLISFANDVNNSDEIVSAPEKHENDCKEDRKNVAKVDGQVKEFVCCLVVERLQKVGLRFTASK